MNIETKFAVGDLVSIKYKRKSNLHSQIMIVMEIHTNTCYAGTQAFYLCRLYTTAMHNIGENMPPTILTLHSVGDKANDIGWNKYREDELVNASQDEIDILKGGRTLQ
jgi:hypothetical protein